MVSLNTAYEAFLATIIFVLILGGLISNLNSIIGAKLVEMRRAQLKVRAEQIAQVTALLLEANPDIFTVDLGEEDKVNVIANALRNAHAVNKLEIGDKEIIQTRIQISFPAKLMLESSSGETLTLSLQSAAPMYYVRLGSKIKIGKFYEKITIGDGEKIILINSGGLYVFGYDKKPLSLLLGDIYYIIYFGNNYPCVYVLERKKPGSSVFRVNSTCVPTLNEYLEVSGNLRFILSYLAENHAISTPYAVICGGSYYVYPDLGYVPALTIFRKNIPKGVVVERSSVLAYVGNFTVLVEVWVWD